MSDDESKLKRLNAFKRDQLFIDQESHSVRYGSTIVPLSDKPIEVLTFLNRLPQGLRDRRQIFEAVWGDRPEGTSDNRVDQTIDVLRVALAPLGLTIENFPRKGWGIAVADEIAKAEEKRAVPQPLPQISDVPWSTPVSFSGQSPFSRGFVLFVDSMIVNLVSELLSEDGPPSFVLHRSRRSYQRALEDFAFAVVYGTRVATGRNFRQSTGDQIDRRLALINQLGPLWEHQTFDESLKDGAILHHPQLQGDIRIDLESLATSIDACQWGFRDWMQYEAYRHLGRHESLRDNDLPPREYVYDVRTNPYYHDNFLEHTIAPRAIDLLAGYLRSGILTGEPTISDSAIRYYVRGTAMSLVTIMHEYRMSCSETGAFRIPHVLRTVIQNTSYSHTQQQDLLKNILVQHVLTTAFSDVNTIDKRSLVTVLINLRELPPFSTIRALLEEASLPLAYPTEANEKKATQLYYEIKRAVDPRLGIDDRVEIRSQAVLRSIRTPEQEAALASVEKVSVDQYAPRLYHLFPELNPSYILPAIR